MATAKKKPRPVKFPEPGNTKGKDELVMIDAERMLRIYNQDHPNQKSPSQRVTPKIVEHSVDLAVAGGWASTAHLKDAQTGHTAGLLLIKPQQTQVNVNLSIVATPAPQAKPAADVVDAKEAPKLKPRKVFKG